MAAPAKQSKQDTIAAKQREKTDAKGGVEIVSDGADPVIRFPVMHVHGGMSASGCYGYLYFSRESVRYEVVGPEKFKSHSFEHSRAEVVKAADPGPFRRHYPNDLAVQFNNGQTETFDHVNMQEVEKAQKAPMFGKYLLPRDPLILAFTNFDQAVAAARASGATVLQVANNNGPPVPVIPSSPGAPAAPSAVLTQLTSGLAQPSPATGFYADTRIDFDTLDGVTVDPRNGTLTLFGHRAGGGAPRTVPFFDYLAAALESNNPTFSLEWTPESKQSIDRAFSMADQDLTNRLAGTVDASGHLTQRGEWWYHMLGADVHQGMDKMSLWTAVFAVTGYPDAAKVMKAVDEVERAASTPNPNQKVLDPDGQRRSPVEHFFLAATSVVVPFDQNFLNVYAGAFNGNEASRETLFSWGLRGMARAYRVDENRYLNRYLSLKRSGTDFGTALAKTLEMSQDDTVAVQKNAFGALIGNRTFVHIPPDIMREVLGVNPVVVPVYQGLPANSLLARVAFEADVFGKNLMDMPEIKSNVPGYRTYFEWRQTVARAPAAEGHTWFAPDAFELLESNDGGTVRFGKTPIRIHMERYDRGAGASGRESVADPLLKQYADELTALYDPLAANFPVLLDLRETMKVMAIADWLKHKGIKLSFPAEGRGVWNPPAQFPGVIHMEIAVKQAPVGEVMSASGGIDFRVDKNWNIIKQRIEEQPGPPPANHTSVDFDPASGKVASAKPPQIDRGSVPISNSSASLIRVGGAGEVRGDVFWLTADGHMVPIKPGTPIYFGEHIITKPGGHMRVMLLDETVFVIGADSDMVIDEFVYDPNTSVGKITARITKGVFRFVSGKVAREQPDNMKINVPTGTIGIRGTDVEVAIAPDNSGSIKLYSGLVEFTDTKTGKVTSMNAGQMVTLNADGATGQPVPLVPDTELEQTKTDVSNPSATSFTLKGAESQGDVYILTSRGAKLSAQDATQVSIDNGARIFTGPNSRATLTLADGTKWNIGPDSEMQLDDFIYDPDMSLRKAGVQMLKGSLRWVTGKTVAAPAQMQINVRQALSIGIRGTDFDIYLAPDGSGYARLYSGQLEITEVKTKFTFLLNPGQMVTFAADGACSRPMPLQP
ncbi:MAG: FecR domain-containing protein [Candidatus Acidiferrales bacterium]